MCFGAAPSAPPPPPPPPQIAQTPSPAKTRADTAASMAAGIDNTFLTGGQGPAIQNGDLGKKTLLGQ